MDGWRGGVALAILLFAARSLFRQFSPVNGGGREDDGVVLVLRATSFFNSVFAQSALTLDLGSGFQGMLLPNTQIPTPVDRNGDLQS